MIRERELLDPESCLNRARPGEWLFVLLGRDVAAPETIRAWCQLRVAMGKNTEDDPQILEALECAREMEVARAGGGAGVSAAHREALDAFLAAFRAYMDNPLDSDDAEERHAEQWDEVVRAWRALTDAKGA